MKLKTLRDVYIHELNDLYSAETQIVAALPKMAEAAEHDELAAAFDEHLTQTEEHIRRLEQIFQQLGETPSTETCKSMEGILAEGAKLLKEDADPSLRDVLLISAAQRVEHYEIAGYGSARTYAQLLGDEEAAETLQLTLDEEAETDERLTEIAESSVNLEIDVAD